MLQEITKFMPFCGGHQIIFKPTTLLVWVLLQLNMALPNNRLHCT